MRSALAALLAGLIFPAAQADEQQIIAYFPEWGVYQQPYYVRSIVDAGSAQKIDVLNYAFVVPWPDGSGNYVCEFDDPMAAYGQVYTAVMSVDGVADAPGQGLFGHFNQLRKLKLINTDLKIVIALGGWVGSTYFSPMALTAASRAHFIDSCIDRFIHGNLPPAFGAGGPGSAAGIFDGFDIDWEYPVTGGDNGTQHNSNDDVNLTALLAEFRAALDAVDPGLLLTIATPANDFRGENFQIELDQQYVNWFNLLSYDFHGAWENKTGHLTNLLTSPDDPSSDAFKLSVDNTIHYYTQERGVPIGQLAIGGTLFGRGWRNVSATNNGLYQNGQAAPGVYESGANYYVDLEPLAAQGYEWFWDDQALAAWLYSPSEDIFWSLDDPQSLALKHRYAEAYGAAGLMVWEVSGDNPGGSLMSALASGNPGEGFTGVTYDEPGLDIAISRPADCAISLEGFNVVINADTTVADISQVEFFGNGESLGFDDRSPWSWAWFNLPAGEHLVHAEITDASGGQNLSEGTRLTVYSNAQLSLWQTGVGYQAGDEVFYEGCIYEAKRNHVGSRVRKPTSGRYWQLVTCSDCGGGSGGNQPPDVAITSPANGAQFSEGATINIAADASDSDGSVVRVEFFQGSNSLGSDATPPYTATWANAEVGSHPLMAVATDDEGASASDSITVTVTSASGCSLTAWDPGATYNKGDEVQHNGIRWRSKRTSQGVEPGTSPSRWTNLGPCVG
ncbi:MAG: glycosyl hydrolase family 18 protein [Xanthomonadales bacterium]|nr:glycosyl hydrolase family 18 protein [Xanthomonadales bacterium]